MTYLDTHSVFVALRYMQWNSSQRITSKCIFMYLNKKFTVLHLINGTISLRQIS